MPTFAQTAFRLYREARADWRAAVKAFEAGTITLDDWAEKRLVYENARDVWMATLETTTREAA